jgi:hypothetical protein
VVLLNVDMHTIFIGNKEHFPLLIDDIVDLIVCSVLSCMELLW